MRKYLLLCRDYFLYAGIFSMVVNVLMLVQPLYTLQVFDRVLTSRSVETLVVLSVFALSILAVHLMVDTIRARILLGAGIALDNLLGPAVLEAVLMRMASPLASTQQVPASLRDVAVLRGFLTGASIFALFDMPWAFFYLVLIFTFHPYIGAVALVAMILLFVLTLINERVSKRPLLEMGKQTREASRFIDAALRNAELVQALGMAGVTVGRWRELNDKVLDAQLDAGRISGIITGLTKFVRLGVQIVAMWVAAYLAILGEVAPGVMMAATMIIGRAMAPVESAIGTWKGTVEARDAWRRLNELLAGGAGPVSAVEMPVSNGRLEVDKVSFGMPGTDRFILRGVSFALASGESLGVVGPSAAGKSTLLRLITGIWRPTSGVVRLAGADVSVWPRAQLGPHIGYLPQDVELFSGTVADNIARLGPVLSEPIINAAQRAGAHELILTLPKGYETEIGMAGAVLSGGQRQRVALARALYGTPRLVILDEPNASLDAVGENALVKAMQLLKQAGVTLVVVSHRPSLLAGVDKMLVLREGLVEFFGPREEAEAKFTRQAAPVAAKPPGAANPPGGQMVTGGGAKGNG